MTRIAGSLFCGALGAAALFTAAPGWAPSASAQPASAQSASGQSASGQSGSAKAVVDAAKAAGAVGEQGDGFLGIVSGGGQAIRDAVAEINAGRAQVYQATAARTGVTVQAAGEATARQLFARVRPGQYYRPLGDGWLRK